MWDASSHEKSPEARGLPGRGARWLPRVEVTAGYRWAARELSIRMVHIMVMDTVPSMLAPFGRRASHRATQAYRSLPKVIQLYEIKRNTLKRSRLVEIMSRFMQVGDGDLPGRG